MEKFVITSGEEFNDIDGLACTIAYSELLTRENKIAEATLPGLLNSSITKMVKGWGLKFNKEPLAKSANYILVDISDPQQFAKFVDQKKIYELFDHRYGFENYWNEKPEVRSHIEMVGSCATLIFEEFNKRINPLRISSTSANLLSCAIVSNTLYFRSSVTTYRDKRAFEMLKNFTDLPDNWIEIYYKELDSQIEKDLEFAIKNDTKTSGPVIAQLELWNSKNILLSNIEKIYKIMDGYKVKDWFLTSPSISEGINYIITRDEGKKKQLGKAIDAKFEGNLGTTEKLWLRKEIIKRLGDLELGVQ